MDTRRKKIIKTNVRSSVAQLIAKAQTEPSESRSKRYVKMAVDLMKKNRISLPKELRNSFCRKCHVPWVLGETATASYDRKHDCLRVKCICGFSKRI
ncbi:hypothetical protein JXA56_03905 [Candidatus Micrarchaeota archaeon]|nr:hypothetical protein [Candidatus Micrarchaeota archaeon]